MPVVGLLFQMIKKSKQRIDFGSDSSGISIEYIKSRNVIVVSGWYDSFVGIESNEIDFNEFCEVLGVPKKVLEKLTANNF